MRTVLLLLTCIQSGIAAGADHTLSQLAWLQGCWKSSSAEVGSGESWSSPAGGTMLGTSRTIRNGSTRSHEFILVRDNDDGTLAYIASPSAQSTATFTSVEVSATRVVFENKAHDFPQRIIYEQPHRDQLIARIEGTEQGKQRSAAFPMQRTECPL